MTTRTMKQIASQPQMNTDIFNPPPYSSIFFYSSPSPTTFTAAPSTSAVKSTIASTSITAAAAKSLSRIMSEHKELLKRYELCLIQLRNTFKESETLRQENTNLRLANAELNNQLNLLIEATLRNQKFGVVLEKETECDDWSEGLLESSQSQSQSQSEKDQEDNEKDEDSRVTLPKSISVRSNGYSKTNPNSTNDSPPLRSVNEPKKVYVRGGTKKDGAIELEVYNQGMFKTELCNKWQETGSCPYGDHCQFAHGIKELRPVIRHPRYKTEVCRMVLAGDRCPYGHRCHFRHALTDEEKLMLPLRFD